ncbi:hypothetical protein [Bradyrhizobium sp.]|uniref:hypothetical protein n=1 Tax=Bradyrhizobium sp. TaxID=376 RepID=UPI0040382E5B
MNHTMARLWDAGSLLLNAGRLVDLLLDRLEGLSAAMLPPQPEMIALREIHREARFD